MVAPHATPTALTYESAAHMLCPLPDERLVLSKSTMAHPSEVYVLGPLQESPKRRLTRIADAGLKDTFSRPAGKCYACRLHQAFANRVLSFSELIPILLNVLISVPQMLSNIQCACHTTLRHILLTRVQDDPNSAWRAGETAADWRCVSRRIWNMEQCSDVELLSHHICVCSKYKCRIHSPFPAWVGQV
jgi:hypothetical protein